MSAERKWRKTKLTIHFEILREKLKIHNNAVRQAWTSRFAKLMTDHKNNPKILFSTINLLINTDVNKFCRIPTDPVSVDFADRHRSKIDVNRSRLLLQHNIVFNTSEHRTGESFVLVNAEMLGRVLDPIPTPFWKTFHEFFELLNIMNYSLQTGVFPAAFKAAVVKPLPKIHSDPNNLDNYPPVLNLLFLSQMMIRSSILPVCLLMTQDQLIPFLTVF